MGRWEPDAAGRLRTAAMELFLAQGYEQTTVAQIADRAGVTARTFFRYFSDKREVLFSGSEGLQQAAVDALKAAPSSASPMEAIAAALAAIADVLPAEPAYPAQRNAVIAANPSLTERELIKMAALTAALRDGLRQRGVREPDASLAAEAAIIVFRVGFNAWISHDRNVGLAAEFRTALDHLAALSTGL